MIWFTLGLLVGVPLGLIVERALSSHLLVSTLLDLPAHPRKKWWKR